MSFWGSYEYPSAKDDPRTKRCSLSYKLELSPFLLDKHIDVMLVSESHLTNKYKFNLRGYCFYTTNHPDGEESGGTGILIRNRINHHHYKNLATIYIQSTSIRIKLDSGYQL